MARQPQRQSDRETHHEDGRPLGGQELPDDVQDRPEQNVGYDEAVRGDARVDPADVDVTVRDERVGLDEDLQAGDVAEAPASAADQRAAREAAAKVGPRDRRP